LEQLGRNLIGRPVTPSDWIQNGVDVLHLPTQDFTAPTTAELQSAVDFMTRITKAGKKVYVHCKAGRGRSVACVVCYCIVNLGKTTKEAVDFILTKRSHINMGEGQMKSCLDFESNYKMVNQGTHSMRLSADLGVINQGCTDTSNFMGEHSLEQDYLSQLEDKSNILQNHQLTELYPSCPVYPLYKLDDDDEWEEVTPFQGDIPPQIGSQTNFSEDEGKPSLGQNCALSEVGKLEETDEFEVIPKEGDCDTNGRTTIVAMAANMIANLAYKAIPTPSPSPISNPN